MSSLAVPGLQVAEGLTRDDGTRPQLSDKAEVVERTSTRGTFILYLHISKLELYEETKRRADEKKERRSEALQPSCSFAFQESAGVFVFNWNFQPRQFLPQATAGFWQVSVALSINGEPSKSSKYQRRPSTQPHSNQDRPITPSTSAKYSAPNITDTAVHSSPRSLPQSSSPTQPLRP
jgi:hypothetical protein